MTNTFRALFGVSALALLLVAAPVLAAEVDVTAENVLTGADSDNENDYEIDHEVDVDFDNDADVDNDVDVDTDTGDNEQNQNTTGGDLESGAADVTGSLENVVNEGAGLCGCPIEDGGVVVDGEFSNELTGYDSDNDNDLDVDVEVDYDVDNDADIDNDVDADLDTGDNEQNMNTTAGSMTTGNALFDVTLGNWANNSTGGSDGDAAGVAVNVSGSNETTGADSDNENEFDIDVDYNVDVNNDADIDNDVDADVDTGGNEQNMNTTAGDLKTGNGEVIVGIENHANNSDCCPSLGGAVTVEADFSNDTTGYNSDNENSLEVEHDVDVDVDNDADINNDVDADVDTGDNEQNQNTTGGSVQTGDATVEFTIVNSANNTSN